MTEPAPLGYRRHTRSVRVEGRGAKISRFDPENAGTEVSDADAQAVKRTLNETAEGADCVVLLGAQEQFRRLNLKKLKAIMKSPTALVDLAGLIDPLKAEEEGFIYRGLGRGVGEK